MNSSLLFGLDPANLETLLIAAAMLIAVALVRLLVFPAGLNEAIDQLAGRRVRQTSLDPDLEGEVTVQLTDVSARTTMNAVCEMLNCKWWITEGPPRRLRVKNLGATGPEATEPAGDLDTEVSLSLEDAPVEEVFKSFAQVGNWKLNLQKPTVSVELADTPIRQALDEVCAQVDCTWSLDMTGDRGVLRIEWVD